MEARQINERSKGVKKVRNLLAFHRFLATKPGKIAVTAASLATILALVASCAGSPAPETANKATTSNATPATSAKPASEAKPSSSESKPAASEPKPAAPAAAKEPYKVGLVTAFTGSRAETMQNAVRAARLTVDTVNNAGGIDGHKVQLIEYDNEEDPQKSIPVIKRLVEQDKVSGIIGPGINAAIQASKPLLKDGPVMSVMSASGKPEPDSYVFQTPVTQPTLQRMLFQYFKKQNYPKVALLATTDATGEDSVKNIDAIAKEIGGVEVVVERYNASDVDVTPQLTKIRSDKDIKALVIWSTGKQAATPIMNAAQLGLDIPIQVSMGNHSNNFIKLVKNSLPKTLWIGTERGSAWYDLPDNDQIKPVAKAIVIRSIPSFSCYLDPR
ncbi:MAG: ABC transporter substrate-binding protein, partial [Chloroflexi bacterium]|nr:ABC transporter substrate-binding protein [Chloroflexota bacterium]